MPVQNRRGFCRDCGADITGRAWYYHSAGDGMGYAVCMPCNDRMAAPSIEDHWPTTRRMFTDDES